MFTHRFLFAILGSAACLGLGCTGPSPPDPSDPVAGRDLLQKSLDSWKRGETPEAYKQANPSVTVIEPAWKSGSKLIDFEITAEHAASGYDVRLKAKLTVQEPGGSAKKQQNALYNVCTTPNLVVKRAEGSW